MKAKSICIIGGCGHVGIPRLLGFSADTSLDQILDEVVPWIEEQIRLGGI